MWRCHGDSSVKDGLWPGIQYPRVPGHEVISVIDAVGPNVPDWKSGQRVGIGWHASHCGHCDPCRRGEFFACQVELLTTGISFDGGYAEYMVAPAKALASVPTDLNSVEGAPLTCAGITTFNSEDTLKFSVLQGVQSMNEIFPLEKATEAYDRMLSGKARFRVVLDVAAKS